MTLGERYAAAAHRMQSAVAYDITKRLFGDEPGGMLSAEAVNKALKDVRVGINSALSAQGGLADLLISKGVFTQEEYVQAVTVAMEREADERVDEVRRKYNLPPSVRFA